MADVEFLNTQRGQRIDQRDMEHTARHGPNAARAEMPKALVLPDETWWAANRGPGPRACVVRGFGITNPSARLMTVTRGIAFGAMRDRGVVRDGIIIAEGDESITLDLQNHTQATLGIYIRFTLIEGDVKNRVFWNPTATPAAEYIRTVPTRLKATWEVVVEAASPGDEWMQIGIVAVGGSSLVVTGTRQFLFEGDEYLTSWDINWGSGNDRHADRATYGAHSLYQFLGAMRLQIKDILGGTGWYQTLATAGAESLKSLKDTVLRKDGSVSLTGDLLPDNTTTRDLGSTAKSYAETHSERYKAPGILYLNPDTGGAGGVVDRVVSQGTSFFLGTQCQGTNGIYRETVTFIAPINCTPADNFDTITVSLSASPALSALDDVVSIQNQVSPLMHTERLFISDSFISGSNTLTLRIGNLDSSATRPSAQTTYQIDVVVIRGA